MPAVIKATDPNRGLHVSAFNLEDMAQRAEDYLAKVREHAAQQAQEIVAQAMRESEGVRKQAESEGRQSAEQAIDRKLNEKVAAQMKTVLPALRLAVDQIAQAKQGWLAAWERQAIELSACMAERIVRGELAARPAITVAWAREALEMAAGQGDVCLRLHPDDHAAMGAEISALTGDLARLGAVSAVADASVSPGGCRVETRYGAIDQTVEAQVARLVQELS